MNVLLVDEKSFPREHLKHLMDACKQVSGSEDWLVLPKGIDIIRNMPIEHLEVFRDRLNELIEKHKNKEEQS